MELVPEPNNPSSPYERAHQSFQRTRMENSEISVSIPPLSPRGTPAEFSTLVKTRYYNDSHRALQREARQFYETEVFPYAVEWEEKGETPPEVLRKIAAKGWLLPFVPSKYRPRGQAANDNWDAFHAMIVGFRLSYCLLYESYTWTSSFKRRPIVVPVLELHGDFLQDWALGYPLSSILGRKSRKDVTSHRATKARQDGAWASRNQKACSHLYGIQFNLTLLYSWFRRRGYSHDCNIISGQALLHCKLLRMEFAVNEPIPIRSQVQRNGSLGVYSRIT